MTNRVHSWINNICFPLSNVYWHGRGWPWRWRQYVQPKRHLKMETIRSTKTPLSTPQPTRSTPTSPLLWKSKIRQHDAKFHVRLHSALNSKRRLSEWKGKSLCDKDSDKVFILSYTLCKEGFKTVRTSYRFQWIGLNTFCIHQSLEKWFFRVLSKFLEYCQYWSAWRSCRVWSV